MPDRQFRFSPGVLEFLGLFQDPVTGQRIEPEDDEIDALLQQRERDLEDFVSQQGSIPAGAEVVVRFAVVAGQEPAGLLLENGTVKDRATYPALFAAIGTTFNTGGEAADEFRLPNEAPAGNRWYLIKT